MINIVHLEKKHANETTLRDVTTKIQEGDVISIIGPSGSGKSTLLRCMNMLDKPTVGQIIIDGEDITDPKTDISKVRRKIAMVFQAFTLFSHKMVVENVMMGPMDLLKVSKQQAFDDAVKYLKRVGLGEKLYAYPEELSGGQKQRVEIARCLAMEPKIILFDEPTSALDPTMVGEVQAVIRELAKQGRTMMIVTHNMKFSREIANRVFYMDEGTIYEEGTSDEIFEHPKREKTRAFVKQLKSFRYYIYSKDYDMYQMNAMIDEFGKNHTLNEAQIYNIQLLLEELIVNNIITHTDDIEISIGYFEVDDRIEITLVYGGTAFNPFENEKEDILSMLLVRQLTQEVSYIYGEKNKLSFAIQNRQ